MNKTRKNFSTNLTALFYILFQLIKVVYTDKSPPNIIFILADDLGWNDVSFHGSSQIFTPHIDALAYSGIILNSYYVNPICTPSRSALMTGKYPIHTGMQHTVLFGAEARGLPLTEKILPQYLKDLGYSNHIVGKWHLGSYTKAYTPLMRGFESHVGFWTGHQDYFDHTAEEKGMWGLDMRRNFDVAYDLHGKYITDVISNEAVKVIHNRNTSQPLFLYVAHAASHSGNSYNPLPAFDDDVAKIKHIDDFNRRKFAAIVQHMDKSVGEIVNALAEENILNNSIIIFSSDNGGPAAGFNLNAASNFPLRGVKNTLWEGGIRAAGFIWSPLLKQRARVSNQLFHISDWLPTLYHAAGGNSSIFKQRKIDGIDQFEILNENLQSSRTEVLHNIDNIWGSSSLMMDKWKLVVGTNYDGQWDYWYGPVGNRTESSYSINDLLNSSTAKALEKLNMLPDVDTILRSRRAATVACTNIEIDKCKPLEKPCLFDILNDPCEENNLADKYPNIMKTLMSRLNEFNASSIPASNLPIDQRGNPKYHNYVWTNWGDFNNDVNEHSTIHY
ncbi:hypothetical protein PVAND_005986 [Polypedilum vanderplanki]|uniref:Sulfatase N-terminal domain-containing protein n=1 Tax=Polypedilum vanderplanki TaxID=319348 RepID=A0A9J6C272_POLVA|nr:hypothetical protein PVAND_005986 [Polypedilum vanderplanki]